MQNILRNDVFIDDLICVEPYVLVKRFYQRVLQK